MSEVKVKLDMAVEVTPAAVPIVRRLAETFLREVGHYVTSGGNAEIASLSYESINKEIVHFNTNWGEFRRRM